MGGVIAETGTHEELMASETYYKKLVDTQGDAALAARLSSTVSKRASTMSFGASSELDPDDFNPSEPLIVFRNVSFCYPTRPNKPILERFKLKIFKGGRNTEPCWNVVDVSGSQLTNSTPFDCSLFLFLSLSLPLSHS
jgi:ABC-type multidrug transport system fused ATPase/permease subunit